MGFLFIKLACIDDQDSSHAHLHDNKLPKKVFLNHFKPSFVETLYRTSGTHWLNDGHRLTSNFYRKDFLPRTFE